VREASKESPFYFTVRQENSHATKSFMLVCDEGWRQSIVCTGMYEWAADWLVNVLQGKPYAKSDVEDTYANSK
jgi:hypothetical protein